MKVLISVPVVGYETYEVEASTLELGIAEFCKNCSTMTPVKTVSPEMAKTAIKPVTTNPRKTWEAKHFSSKK